MTRSGHTSCKYFQVVVIMVTYYAPFFMLALYWCSPALSVILFFIYSLINSCGAAGTGESEASLDLARAPQAQQRASQRHGSDEGSASGRNTPRPNGFMVNSRGRKLYYRVLLPDSTDPPSCLMILLHGYAAHFNRPGSVIYIKELLAKNVAVATLDFEGHGYSEGLRCHIKDVGDFVADVVQFVDLTQSGAALVSSSASLYDPTLSRSSSTQSSHLIAALPLFISGQSLGGAIALLASERIAHRADPLPNWRGAILLCPALDGNTPPAAVIFFLQWCVLPFFPTRCMPTFLDSTSDTSAIWKTRSLCEWHLNFDNWGKPGALGWGNSMRWGTGGALIKMIGVIDVVIKRCDFPMLALHDPKDAIIPFQGTLKLKQTAPSKDIEYVEMNGALHDMVTNEPGTLAAHMAAWANKRL